LHWKTEAGVEIHLRPEAPAELRDADDFRAFKVVAHGFRSPARLRRALDEVGRAVHDGHVFVRAEWLHAHAEDAPDPADWRRRLDEMIKVAARHGWLDDAGRIRAHVEQRDD
jgi:SOS response regulatory protein OraA/RecX